MNFRQLFAELAIRPRMFLLDDRYLTLVAFVEGCNAATDWQLLDGFGNWVSMRILGTDSSLHWSTVVASRRSPELLNEPRSGPIPSEVEAGAAKDLLEFLDEFLGTNS